jgi:hypothetical protein
MGMARRANLMEEVGEETNLEVRQEGENVESVLQ